MFLQLFLLWTDQKKIHNPEDEDQWNKRFNTLHGGPLSFVNMAQPEWGPKSPHIMAAPAEWQPDWPHFRGSQTIMFTAYGGT
jgi:hypothetical protein